MNQRNEPSSVTRPTVYQIRLDGRLDGRWAAWFEGVTIATEDGHTLLTTPALDQAALYGLLRKVRDLGLPLISITRVEPSAADAPSQTP